MLRSDITTIMDLSEKNLRLATQYFLEDRTEFDKKDEDYKNLFKVLASDNNSSTLREAVTLYILNYKSYSDKHGPDGYDPDNNRQKEVKPRFIREGKLGNSGNFNDLTMDLLEKKKNLDIVCSLFYVDTLIYLVEFPIEVIMERLKKPVAKAIAGKRVVAQFTWKDYDSNLLKIHYLNTNAIDKFECLSKDHARMLKTRYQND